MSRIIKMSIATALIVALASPALAHVTIDKKEAPVGSFYKAVFAVPHGCEGSPTVSITIQIPEGVISVKPKVNPGWTLAVKRGTYAKPYAFLHGARFTQGVTEVTWSGGNLPDAYFDEFVLTTFIAGELAAGTTLYFPVIQTCEKGENRWIEVPTADKPGAPLSQPAPGLKLLPAAAAKDH